MTDTSPPAEIVRNGTIALEGTRYRIECVIDHHDSFALIVARREDEAGTASPSSSPVECTFDHVDDDIQPLLWGTADDRAVGFLTDVVGNRPWIAREAQARVIARLEDVLDSPPNQHPTSRFAIVGTDGAGKKAAVRRFRNEHGTYVAERAATSVPVVLVRSWGSGRQFYEACLDEVDVQRQGLSARLRRAGMKNAERRQIALDAMREAGVRLLIVETLHHYVDPGSAQVRQRLQLLDELADELGVVVASLLRSSLRLPGTWPSAWRHAEHLPLERCEFGPEFGNALTAFGRRLPLREPSEFLHPAMAGRLYAMSQGNLGSLWDCLVRFTTEALLAGVERIDHALINRIEQEDREALEASEPYDSRWQSE